MAMNERVSEPAPESCPRAKAVPKLFRPRANGRILPGELSARVGERLPCLQASPVPAGKQGARGSRGGAGAPCCGQGKWKPVYSNLLSPGSHGRK